MLLSAACKRDPEPLSLRERLEAAASGLDELEQLRQRHEALVRGVLEVREQPQELPGRRRRETRGCSEEEALQKSILLLRKQLSCLRRRDTGLITQLQELDRQISELRLDTEASHGTLEADSRPSSGFFDLSDGASVSLSNSSNSVFSECFCVTAEADTHFLSAEEHPGCLDCDWSQPPTLDSTHQGEKPRLSGLTPAHLWPSAPLPASPSAPPPPAAATAAPQRRLDGYILGLLQRRATPLRPGRPRTGISTEPSRGLRSVPDLRGLPWASGGALPGGCAVQKVSDSCSVLMEKTGLLPSSEPRLCPPFPSHPSAPPGPRYLPAASCLSQEGVGSEGRGSRALQGSRVVAVGGACGRNRRSISKDLGAHRSTRRRCHRHRRPRPPTLPQLPPRDQPLRRSGATCRSRGDTATRQQPKQPVARSAHRPRPTWRRQAMGNESEYSAESASLLHCPLAEVGGSSSSSSSSSICFGDGESVQENLEKETLGRGRNQGRPLRPEVTRSVVRIKASHQLKKKILRFRSGSLKLMTTV